MGSSHCWRAALGGFAPIIAMMLLALAGEGCSSTGGRRKKGDDAQAAGKSDAAAESPDPAHDGGGGSGSDAAPDAAGPGADVPLRSGPVVDFDVWRAARVRWSACAGLNLWGEAFDTSMVALPSDPETAAQEACAASAMSCEEFESCFDWDCGHTKCAGDPNGNTECMQDDLGYATCAVKACFYGGTWDDGRCEEDTLIRCDYGLEVRRDCARLLAACQRKQETDGVIVEGSCVRGLSAPTCKHAELYVCLDNETMAFCEGKERAGNWGKCTWKDPRLSCLVTYYPGIPLTSCSVAALERECDEGSWLCEGTVAKRCQGGLWEDFDCGALPGATCVSSSNNLLRCSMQ